MANNRIPPMKNRTKTKFYQIRYGKGDGDKIQYWILHPDGDTDYNVEYAKESTTDHDFSYDPMSIESVENTIRAHLKEFPNTNIWYAEVTETNHYISDKELPEKWSATYQVFVNAEFEGDKIVKITLDKYLDGEFLCDVSANHLHISGQKHPEYFRNIGLGQRDLQITDHNTATENEFPWIDIVWTIARDASPDDDTIWDFQG